MLQPTRSQKVGQDLATEAQQCVSEEAVSVKQEREKGRLSGSRGEIDADMMNHKSLEKPHRITMKARGTGLPNTG